MRRMCTLTRLSEMHQKHTFRAYAAHFAGAGLFIHDFTAPFYRERVTAAGEVEPDMTPEVHWIFRCATERRGRDLSRDYRDRCD